jgi:putative transposase
MRLPDGSIRKRRSSAHEEGQAHELTFSCYRRLPLLSKDRSRIWLLESLRRARTQHSFDLWAYVLMPEHVHLLLKPRAPDADIGAILRAIKQPVAQTALRFLKREAPDWLCQLESPQSNGRPVHRFWQPGGGYDRNVDNARVAWASVEYLHANPVRRGLVASATDWPWSSARWYGGLAGVELEMDGRPPESS